ncbi:uncharacterized protein LOC118569873 [Onychomys torridus]|uniref:uncharacterized protein LOC118569873 n=1 Tax=Onychomys torridus TaxID=38674 RepID=UPI00167FD50E|nr:uncharacterized protein LOC118569873 [Onychomys torridus]
MYNLSLEHKDPQDLRGHQGRMALREGMVSRVTLVKMGDRVTLGLRAFQGLQERWAPRVRREILVLDLEDLQDLQGHQDPPSDRTSSPSLTWKDLVSVEIWRASEAHEVSLAPQDPLVSQDCLVSQGALGSTAPMLQDLQAFLVCLGRKAPPDFLVPRDLQVLPAKRAHQEWLARKAVLAMWESQDPRGAKATLGLSVYLERLAWLDPLGQLGPQDPQDLLGHQDQDLLLDS